MDKSFEQMSALLQAVWPAVSNIDWSQYCTKGVSAYDDAGAPKYTGLIMHRAGGGCVGASTVAVGFLPRPEQSAIIVTNKTGVVTDPLNNIKASIECREPDNNIWGGGVRCSTDDKLAYAITGLPEIGDHLLVAEMMWICNILSLSDLNEITNFEFKGVETACDRFGMDITNFDALEQRITEIVEGQAVNLGLLS
jgi:hypothetical protein